MAVFQSKYLLDILWKVVASIITFFANHRTLDWPRNDDIIFLLWADVKRGKIVVAFLLYLLSTEKIRKHSIL